MLMIAGIFVGVLALVVGSYWAVVVVPESRGQTVVRERLKWNDPVTASLRLLKKQEVLSGIGVLNAVLESLGGFSGRLKEKLDSAGIKMTVGTFILLTTFLFFAGAVVVNFYTGLWWLGLLAGLGGALTPTLVVAQIKSRRVHKFEEQFPEAVDLIARAMRAGHAFPTGLKMAADELLPPAGAEFRLLYEKQNFGAQLPDALRSFAERIPSLDARFFVTAVLTQREAGGNLAEVLDRLAAVMRERFRIKREVRTRSAHGRITAFILAGLPPALALIMMSSQPENFKLMITDPLGIRMLIFAVVMQIIGVLIVRKLVDIEY
jgi:tight adherence protein B